MINSTLKLPDNCKLLSEFNGYVLAQRDYTVGNKQRTEYITWQKGESGGVILGHYYNALQPAKEDFALRSELVNPDKLFSKDELAVLYKGLSEYENSRTVDYDNEELCNHIENIREKLQRIPNVDIEKYSKITILIVEPNKEPCEKQIANDLYSFQDAVGGYIEVVHSFDDNAVIVCNEAGKINNLPLNRVINDDVIVGAFVIAGMKDDNFSSLSTDQIVEFKDKFRVTNNKDIFKKSIDKAMVEVKPAHIRNSNRER